MIREIFATAIQKLDNALNAVVDGMGWVAMKTAHLEPLSNAQNIAAGFLALFLFVFALCINFS